MQGTSQARKERRKAQQARKALVRLACPATPYAIASKTSGTTTAFIPGPKSYRVPGGTGGKCQRWSRK